MRNFKRFLALVLAMLMLSGMTMITTGAAEETVDYSDAAQRLASINILKGDTNGDLMLDQGVTRWHTALFFVQALTGRTEAAEWNAVKESTTFTDVPEYGTAIDYAAGIGLIRGRGNGIYGYNDSITYQDMMVMAVRALGYEETGMSYPYGYILAAEKLELNKNLATDIQYTDALTRGETAQIIWNMMTVYKAYVDPVSKKILYPNDKSATGLLFGQEARTTLLVEGGFSQGTLEGDIVAFTEGRLSSDIDTVTVKINGVNKEFNAAHLGITEKTRKATYLNLPVKLYINTTAAKFETEYNPKDEECEAKVVFADLTEFTSVVNLADEGNIKYSVDTAVTPNVQTITLDGQKFTSEKYDFDLRVLTENGWTVNTNPATSLTNFTYDTKNGYTGNNSYGEIQYVVLTDEDPATKDELLMLYMPYSFGRYTTRTLRYQPTLTDESFVLVATYEPGMLPNKDGNNSHFYERLLGWNFTADSVGYNVVKEGDTSLSEADGKASKEVTVTGESVKNKEFMFYYYNALDNVLHVASVEGAMKSGQMTSYNQSKQTIKIDGTTYEYGFAGAYKADHYSKLAFGERYYDSTSKLGQGYFVLDEALKRIGEVPKNLSYILAGGRVVFTRENSVDTEAKQHSFAIVSVKDTRVAELLDISLAKYTEAANKTQGLYIDNNGNVAVAVLNTSSGKWELGAVSAIEMEYDANANGTIKNVESNGEVTVMEEYDAVEDEFPVTVNLGTDLKNMSVFGTVHNSDKITAAVNHLKKDGVFMVRANKSKVYTLAPVVDECLDYGTVDNGLVFSDQAARTNHIKGVQDAEVDPARVTLTAKSVVVAINENGEIGVRTGIQKNANSLDAEHIASAYGKTAYTHTANTVATYNARFYSAKAALIVMKFDGPVSLKEGTNGTPTAITVDVEKWGDAAAATENETYYIATNDVAVEYEKLDDETYNVTVSGLYDLRKMKMASDVVTNVDSLSDAAWSNGLAAKDVLYLDKTGKITDKDTDGTTTLTLIKALEYAAEMHEDGTDDDYKVIAVNGNNFTFKDGSTIAVSELGLNGIGAVGEINVVMATLNMSDIDSEYYDYDAMVLDEAYNTTDAREKYNGVTYYRAPDPSNPAVMKDYYDYNMDKIGETVTISEPVAGQLNQFIIDMEDEIVLIPEISGTYLDNAARAKVTFTAVGMFDEESGVVDLYIIKCLENAPGSN